MFTSKDNAPKFWLIFYINHISWLFWKIWLICIRFPTFLVLSTADECKLIKHNNNNNWISLAPYGRNFRGAGSRSDQCSVKAWLNRKVLSQDLKTDRESLIRIVYISPVTYICTVHWPWYTVHSQYKIAWKSHDSESATNNRTVNQTHFVATSTLGDNLVSWHQHRQQFQIFTAQSTGVLASEGWWEAWQPSPR